MEINIDKCLEYKLPFEGFFVLMCLYNDEKDKITNYVVNVNKIPTHVFNLLVKNGYIICSSKSTPILYTLENIELTEKFGKDVLKVIANKNISFDDAFQQLREHYPVKAGNSERRLHGDVARCKKLYQSAIVKNGKVDEELHSTILQCINFEVKLRHKNRSSEYFKLLATWLQQKEWELYIKDVEELIKRDGYVDKKSELGGGFSDEV